MTGSARWAASQRDTRTAGSARWAASHLRLAVAALALLAWTFAPGAAHAGDGAQFAGNCDSTYVNKKVGDNEQWAITWEIFGNASGNVFKLDGSAPSFIECELVGEDDTSEIFDCYGSDACTAPPCGGTQWTLIGSNVSIPLSFFLPAGVDAQSPFDSCEPAA